MCRAFNFCNPQKVEAIIEYLFDHSNQKKKKKKKLSVVKLVLKLFALSAHSLTLLMALSIINNTGLHFFLRFLSLKPHLHNKNFPQELGSFGGTSSQCTFNTPLKKISAWGCGTPLKFGKVERAKLRFSNLIRYSKVEILLVCWNLGEFY